MKTMQVTRHYYKSLALNPFSVKQTNGCHELYLKYGLYTKWYNLIENEKNVLLYFKLWLKS